MTGRPPWRLGRASVRTRTTIAAVVVLLPTLTAVATVGVLLQRQQLERAVSLVAEEQARSVAREVDRATTNQAAIGSVLGGEETLVQVVGPNGVVRESSPALRGAARLLDRPTGSASRSTLSDLPLEEGDSYAVVAVVTADGGYVVTARSLETVDAATASITGLLVVGVPLVVLVIAGLCWLLIGRALRPVEDLRRRADEVTVTGTGTRLPAPDTGDEIERLAQTLNAMLDRLDASARAQRQFVADASHELRSPVAAIRTVMEVAPPGPDPWEEARRDVLHESDRLARLVEGLLVLARRDAASMPPREAVTMNELVAREAERPRRHPVHCRYDAGAWVRGDPSSLRAAVANLLDNADRHARSIVHVEVRLESPPECDGSATAGDVVISVSDDGNGIAEADRERIFERFVRLDEARSRDAGGAGLGLAITRSVASAHGGSVTVEAARETAGATLQLRLPLVPPVSQPPIG